MKKNDKEPDAMDPREAKEPEEHEVRSAADDMMRVEEHKKNPKLMAKVHAHLHGKAKAIKSIQDIRDARNEMNKKDSKSED